jgi:hypothetical protein
MACRIMSLGVLQGRHCPLTYDRLVAYNTGLLCAFVDVQVTAIRASLEEPKTEKSLSVCVILNCVANIYGCQLLSTCSKCASLKCVAL